MSYVDLDQGGHPGYADTQMDMGPTHGRVNKPNRLPRIITSGVASTLQPWDAILFLNLTVKAAYTLTLLPVANWLKFPHGQIPVLVKFLNDNDGNALTIAADAADTIDGLASVVITPIDTMAPFPSAMLYPRSDLEGWFVG